MVTATDHVGLTTAIENLNEILAVRSIKSKLLKSVNIKHVENVLIDIVFILKLIEKEDYQILFTSENEAKLRNVLITKSGRAEAFGIDAKQAIDAVFDLDEGLLKDLAPCVLDVLPLGPIMANVLSRSISKSLLRNGLLMLPSELKELLFSLVVQDDQAPEVVLSGEISPEMLLPIAIKTKATQLAIKSEGAWQIYAKLLFIAGAKYDVITRDKLALFRPLQPFNGGILTDAIGEKTGVHELASRTYKNLTSEVRQVEHLLKLIDGRLACLVTEGFLYRTSGDSSLFKAELISNKLLEAVITLPERILLGTGIRTAILIFNTAKTNKNIKFIDASSDHFYTEKKRSELKLTNIDSIVELLNTDSKSGFSISVPVDEVLSNDSSLHVNRYLAAQENQRIEQTLSRYEFALLSDLAEIQVCQMIKPDKNATIDPAEALVLIGTPEIDQLGQINTSTAKSFHPLPKQDKRISSQLLKEGDIIFSIKGTIGNCGIVTADSVGAIPNQTFVIIRLKTQFSSVTPVTLFTILQSEYCKKVLLALVTGSGMKVLKTQDVKDFKVPLPTVGEQAEIEQKRDKLIKIYDEKKRLEKQIDEGLNGFWAVDD